MPRDGSNIYHRPPGTDGVPNYTVESARYNAFTADVEQDLNLPRPVIAGGTGANNAADAMKNLGGELSAQLIVNYNSDPFQAGSFYSAAGATGAPSVNAFTGICYSAVISGSVTTDLFIEARDQVTTNMWVRQKKANVWQPWAQAAGVTTGGTVPVGVSPNTLWWDPTRGKLFIYYQDADSSQWVEAVAVPDVDVNTYVEVAGDNMTGPLILSGDPTLPLGAATKQYADAGDAASVSVAMHLMRSYLAGLTLSTPGASANFTVQPGVAMDSTNAVMMTLAAAITKNMSLWVVGSGNGALDTGTISGNYYDVYLIRRPDTGVVDVIFTASTNASPTLPANYTQFRRIGTLITSNGTQWIKFLQTGDEFLLDPPILDVNGTAVTTAGLVTFSTAPVNCEAMLAAQMVSNTVNTFALIHPVVVNAAAVPGTPSGNYQFLQQIANQGVPVNLRVRLNALRQYRIVSNATGGVTCAFYVATLGWIDRRGRDN